MRRNGLFLLASLWLCLATPWCVRAQGAGAPPPPPAESLDPASAPKTSRDGVLGNAAPGAPAPPSEGLNPETAPISSRDGVAPATTVGKQVNHPSDAPPHPDSDEVAIPSHAPVSPVEVFRLDFMQRALLAGLIVGGTCGFLGIYVILRRVVFLGVALAEMSSAGVALSILTRLPPMLGSVLTMLVGVLLFSVRWGGRRIRQDAFIGIGYVVASAAAILLLAKSPSGEAGLLDLLFGNILTVTVSDIGATGLALLATLMFHLLFYKEILFVAFDPDTAAASGYASRLWEMWLYLTIGVTIAFSIHAVGVLMTFALLVIPPVTALLLTRRMHSAFLVSVAAGAIPVPVGLYLSFVADLPAAATVVAISFALLLLAGVVSRIQANP